MVMLLVQRGANLFMEDGEGYSGLQLAKKLDQNEIVAYLQVTIVKQNLDLRLKWSNLFQEKPILMLELKNHIESTDDVSNNPRTIAEHLRALAIYPNPDVCYKEIYYVNWGSQLNLRL